MMLNTLTPDIAPFARAGVPAVATGSFCAFGSTAI